MDDEEYSCIVSTKTTAGCVSVALLWLQTSVGKLVFTCIHGYLYLVMSTFNKQVFKPEGLQVRLKNKNWKQ